MVGSDLPLSSLDLYLQTLFVDPNNRTQSQMANGICLHEFDASSERVTIATVTSLKFRK